jgi:hypothetical protein
MVILDEDLGNNTIRSMYVADVRQIEGKRLHLEKDLYCRDKFIASAEQLITKEIMQGMLDCRYLNRVKVYVPFQEIKE